MDKELFLLLFYQVIQFRIAEIYVFFFRMPPKKASEPEKRPLIGRVGTNLKVGIVGVPNVGKSTFFNVLTKSSAAAENFPFCTIDPNENKYNFILYYFDVLQHVF